MQIKFMLQNFILFDFLILLCINSSVESVLVLFEWLFFEFLFLMFLSLSFFFFSKFSLASQLFLFIDLISIIDYLNDERKQNKEKNIFILLFKLYSNSSEEVIMLNYLLLIVGINFSLNLFIIFQSLVEFNLVIPIFHNCFVQLPCCFFPHLLTFVGNLLDRKKLKIQVWI